MNTQHVNWLGSQGEVIAKYCNFQMGPHENKSFVIIPSKSRPNGSRPWLWYAPTFYNEYPCEINKYMFISLLKQGFVICGVDIGESYGSPYGRKIFSLFYQYMVTEYHLDAKACLLAQSRGGLMLYNWAAENAEKVKCIAGIYTVCDIDSYPGLDSPELYIHPPAYNMTEMELRKKVMDHNPIDRLAPLAAAKIPILHIHGNVDTVVPLEKNSAELVRRYQSLGGHAEVIVIDGKGHEEVSEFFQSQPIIDFLLSKKGGG